MKKICFCIFIVIMAVMSQSCVAPTGLQNKKQLTNYTLQIGKDYKFNSLEKFKNAQLFTGAVPLVLVRLVYQKRDTIICGTITVKDSTNFKYTIIPAYTPCKAVNFNPKNKTVTVQVDVDLIKPEITFGPDETEQYVVFTDTGNDSIHYAGKDFRITYGITNPFLTTLCVDLRKKESIRIDEEKAQGVKVDCISKK